MTSNVEKPDSEATPLVSTIDTQPIGPVVDTRPMNIWQRINAVRAEVGSVDHDKTIGDGGYAYQVTTHKAILRRLRPLMAKYGLVDWIELCELSAVDTGRTVGGKNLKVTQYQGEVIYRVRNADNPDEMHSFPVEAHADETGDKGPGKVYTYALKAGQKILFQIGTGDDDEEQRVDSQPAPEPTITKVQMSVLLELADEYYGDDAGDVLKRLCTKLLQVDRIEDIPYRLVKVAMSALRKQAIRDGKVEPDKPAAADDV